MDRSSLIGEEHRPQHQHEQQCQSTTLATNSSATCGLEFSLLAFAFWRLCGRTVVMLCDVRRGTLYKLLVVVAGCVCVWMLAVASFLPFISIC